MATRKSVTPHARIRTMGVISILLLLLGIGLIMVYDASIAEATRLFGNRYHFAVRHAAWVVTGLLCLWVTSRIPTALIKTISPFLFAGSMMLLVVVLHPSVGTSIKGAQRWIRVAELSIQPSEIVKLATVLYIAAWLTHPVRPVAFFLLVGIQFALLLFQPDLGTAIVIAVIALSIYIVSGASLRILGAAMIIGVAAVAAAIWVSPYRRERVLTFLDPNRDPLGSSYQLHQSIIALGSGGAFGLGLGRSRQKFQYLPEATTDAIFAVLGEEFGFMGSATVIGLYAVLIYLLFRLARFEQHAYRRGVVVGVASWLATQAVLNIGSTTGVLPYTGIPLPFMSYGGSSLVTQLVAMGLVARISMTHR